MFASKVSDEPQNGSFYFGGGMAIVGFICSLTTGLLVLQIKPASYDDDYVVSSPTGGSSDRASEGDTSAKPAGRNFPAPKRAQQDLPETAPEGDETNAFEPGTETVTETVMPDGSRKIIKTTVDMDGSKSVTETIVKQSE